LTQAQDSVSTELQRLDTTKQKCLEAVDAEFDIIIAKVERRKAELHAAVTAAARDKKHVLEEQHALIESEKNKVERECEGLQYQVMSSKLLLFFMQLQEIFIFKVEVRNITQRIGSLSDQLDAAVALSEPRENAFITSEFNHNDAFTNLEQALNIFGRVRSSTTLPGIFYNI
jgi:tripartite motif-containing protein 2/3